MTPCSIKPKMSCPKLHAHSAAIPVQLLHYELELMEGVVPLSSAIIPWSSVPREPGKVCDQMLSQKNPHHVTLIVFLFL